MAYSSSSSSPIWLFLFVTVALSSCSEMVSATQSNGQCSRTAPDVRSVYWGDTCAKCISICKEECSKDGRSYSTGICERMGRAFAMACCCGGSPPPPPPSPSPPPPPPSPPPPSPPPPSPSPPPPSLSPPPPPSPSSDPCPSLEKKCKLEETYVEFHAFNTDKCSLCRSGCRKRCKSMGSTVGKQMCLNESEPSTLFCTCCCKDNTPASVSTSRVDYM